MRPCSGDARHWLKRYLDVPDPSPFQIGQVLGEQDRQQGREDPALLDEFGFSETEKLQALLGWRKGLGLRD